MRKRAAKIGDGEKKASAEMETVEDATKRDCVTIRREMRHKIPQKGTRKTQ